MNRGPLVSSPAAGLAAPVGAETGAGLASEAEFRALVGPHLPFVARMLRRMGVWSADLEDAMQKVLLVAHRRLHEIEPGKERSFLVGIALRMAAHERRARRRRQNVLVRWLGLGQEPTPSPEETTERRQMRRILDDVLDDLPEELRAVFVLFELEELPTAEIAALLGLPSGTVASRLRRARVLFEKHVLRLRRGGLL